MESRSITLLSIPSNTIKTPFYGTINCFKLLHTYVFHLLKLSLLSNLK